MNEYPIPIAELDEAFSIARGESEDVVYRWDLKCVAAGQYQIRAIDHLNEVVGSRSIRIHQVMDEHRSNYPLRATFELDGLRWDLTNIWPSEDDLFFMLRVFVHSNPYYDDGRPLDFCEDGCERSIPEHMGEDHTTCVTCGEVDASATMEFHEIHGMDSWETAICASCNRGGYGVGDIDDVVTCMDCSEHYWTDNGDIYYRTIMGRGEGYYCDYCTEGYMYCEGCDRYGDSDEFNENDYGEYNCESCQPQVDERLIREWNYRPEMIFSPSIPVDPLKPLYIGMEIEIQWDDYHSEANEWLTRMNDEYGEILYFKSDSSVEYGFELVTHPLSPQFALENFPFHELQNAIDEGAEERHHSTGMHIHIDRGALTTAQMWKFLKVHKAQRELCGIVGGRGTTTDYANWDNNFTPVTENMFSIARKKGEAYGGAARYVPVNLQNEDTIELRYMEGTINPGEIKKNIQWVQALYEFTDFISVEDVKNGVLESPGYLLGWIMDQQAVYPDLGGYLSKRLMAPRVMPVRTSVCA